MKWRLAVCVGGLLLGGCQSQVQARQAQTLLVEPDDGPVLVDGRALSLRGCSLRVRQEGKSQEMPVGLSPPCRFARTGQGTVRIEQGQTGKVLLVESSKKLPPSETAPGLQECDSQLRAVVVAPGRVALSQDIQKISMCAPAIWDLKVFEILSHQVAQP